MPQAVVHVACEAVSFGEPCEFDFFLFRLYRDLQGFRQMELRFLHFVVDRVGAVAIFLESFTCEDERGRHRVKDEEQIGVFDREHLVGHRQGDRRK